MSNDLVVNNEGMDFHVPQHLWDKHEEKLKHYESKREQVSKFIKEKLRKGSDYGHNHEQTDYEKSKNMPRPKPTLLKSGAEKILDYSTCQIKFYPDVETFKMAGASGSICYVGYIIDRELLQLIVPFIMKVGMEYEKNVVRLFSWGEGRGACELNEKEYSSGERKGKPLKGAVNRCIKMAEKRCEVDAVIRTFGLNFSQDNDYDKTGGLKEDDESSGSGKNTVYQKIMMLVMNERLKSGELVFDKKERVEYQKQAQSSRTDEQVLSDLYEALLKIAEERKGQR